MVCYKVEISIDHDIENEYQPWLKEHIKDMMSHKGFSKSNLLKIKQDHKIKYIVMYDIDKKESYDNYIKNHASKMRTTVPESFINKCTINRDLFEVL